MSELQELIRDIAEQHGAVIEDIGISDAAGKIKVVCDTEEGISSEKLNGISKAILNDPLYDEKYAEGYRLEVSSPGIDAPLTLPRHFRKNTGRELEVYHTLEEHKSPLKGFLRNSNDAAIELAVAKKKNNRTLRIPFDKIEYAKIILKW